MHPHPQSARTFQAPRWAVGWLWMMLCLGCPQPDAGTSSGTTGGSSSSSGGSASSSAMAASASSAGQGSSSVMGASSAASSSGAHVSSSAAGSTSGGTGFSPCGQPLCPWPAEPLASAQNLTDVEGPTPNDFAQDLSGAHWNAATGTLWLVRNGGTGGSKAWALEPDGANGWRVATAGGQRAEWTGLGDAEGITQVPQWGDQHVLVLAEGQDVLGHYDFSVGGTVTLVESWDFSAHVPAYDGDLGSEAVTFVPNAALTAGGFVNAQGQADQGTGGLGGLVMVGHQAGGHVYALDLGAGGGTNVRLVGRYGTANTETAALEWGPGNAAPAGVARRRGQ